MKNIKPKYNTTKWRRIKGNETIKQGDKHCLLWHLEDYLDSPDFPGLPDGCIETGYWFNNAIGCKPAEYPQFVFFREKKSKPQTM